MHQEITDRIYWETYYRKNNSSRDEIIRICSEYDFFFDKLIKSYSAPPKTIIEIGAYPGRFLSYVSSKYSLEATALDFNSDPGKITDSFMSMGGGIKGNHSGRFPSI